MISRAFLVAAALLGARPALAQTAPAAPAAAAAQVDPTRLAVATRIAGELLPPGTYRRMMKTVMDQVTQGVMNQMMDMPLKDLIKGYGLPATDAEKLGPGTMRQMMTIMDPAFDQRLQITMRVMGDEIANLTDQLEPEYRAGLAESFAGRFSLDQLAELDRFFATPTGSAYASQSMLLYTDPAMMQRMQSSVPKMMQAMPGIIQKVQAATAGLPAQRNAKSITPEQRKQFMALLASKSDKQ